MKPGAGKSKGSGFERKVGEKISLWLSRGSRRDLLCRTVGSGAQFTSSFNRGQQAGLAGDLRSQDPIADRLCNKFVIEAKFWKDLEVIRFLEKKGELYEALLKVQGEGRVVNKSWWLVCKQNSRHEIIFMSSSIKVKSTVLSHSLFNNTVSMYFLDDLFEKISPEEFLQ